jgi:hypothetical protein
MCFSAGASFGAGAILLAVGTVTLKKAKEPDQTYFALIPFLFAAQQISEGFLWLSLDGAADSWLQPVTTFLFIFFAQMLWPVWVPYAMLRLETKAKRRAVLSVLLLLGIVISLFLSYCLMYYPVEARVLGRHISYAQEYPIAFRGAGGIFYLLTTIAPPFISSVRRMWVLGVAILVSCIITAVFYNDYVVSVWCFFAAVISVVVYVILNGLKKDDNA